jgi:hypothetical protein
MTRQLEFAALFFAMTVACGGSTTPISPGSTPLPEGFCAEACARRADGCLTAEACVIYCERSASDWTGAIGEAFARCVATEPLCYERIDDCVLRTYHPQDATVTVGISASGLEAHEGKIVRVWHDPARPVAFEGSATISGGRFALDWRLPFSVCASGPPLLLAFIDEDGDGRCTPAVDTTHSGHAEWNGDLLAPAFRLTLAPPLHDGAFVCEFLP